MSTQQEDILLDLPSKYKGSNYKVDNLFASLPKDWKEPGLKYDDWEITTTKNRYGSHYIGIKYRNPDGTYVTTVFDFSCPIYGGKFSYNWSTDPNGNRTVNSGFVLKPITMFPKNLPEKAKVNTIKTVSQFVSDAGVIATTISSAIYANKSKFGTLGYKQMPDGRSSVAKDVTPPFKRCDGKNEGDSAFYSIKVKVKSEYSDSDEAKKKAESISDPFEKALLLTESRKLLVPIIVGDKSYTNLTRGEFDKMLRGRRFYGRFTGNLEGVLMPSGTFLAISATQIALHPLPGFGDISKEKLTELRDESVSFFRDMGMDMGADIKNLEDIENDECDDEGSVDNGTSSCCMTQTKTETVIDDGRGEIVGTT